MSAKIPSCAEKRNTCVKKSLSKAAPLDTLAQLGTNDDFDVVADTHCSDKQTLLKRARRKFASHSLSVGLVTAAERNTDSILKQSYWNSYHCAAVLQKTIGGKIKGKYCKCRWCLVCNAIRTAQAINSYSPILDTWSDAHFVTLTQQTVPAHELVSQLDAMHVRFKSIQELAKRNFQRGKSDFKIVAVRKLECTYRPLTDHYHPHYHVITKSKEIGEYLLNQWVMRSPTSNHNAQDIRKANQGSYKELFKYMTKVITGTSKTPQNGLKRYIHTPSLDVIFNAMRRRRTLQSIGFKLSKSIAPMAEVEHEQVEAILQWQQSATDWVDVDTGELLTGYEPVDAMRKIFEDAGKNSLNGFLK